MRKKKDTARERKDGSRISGEGYHVDSSSDEDDDSDANADSDDDDNNKNGSGSARRSKRGGGGDGNDDNDDEADAASQCRDILEAEEDERRQRMHWELTQSQIASKAAPSRDLHSLDDIPQVTERGGGAEEGVNTNVLSLNFSYAQMRLLLAITLISLPTSPLPVV